MTQKTDMKGALERELIMPKGWSEVRISGWKRLSDHNDCYCVFAIRQVPPRYHGQLLELTLTIPEWVLELMPQRLTRLVYYGCKHVLRALRYAATHQGD